MATIISGDTGIDKITDGSVVADDLASTLDLSGKTITLATDAAVVSKLSTASGSAPSYSARAWVNFNGTGTVAIRESKNVSSITDHSTGDYTINFTIAMLDINYMANVTASNTSSAFGAYAMGNEVNRARTTTSWSIVTLAYNTVQDPAWVNVAVFR